MAPYATTGSYTDAGIAAGTFSRQGALYSPQECSPPCPACGGLQCLCRPRFFAGQLLTEEDLNRLDHYLVEKNKLHNRYLHGHGIVCGLDVVCNPCDPKGVIVKPGYALSPCGDDIVVCKDSAVNICDLINQCRPVSQTECDPMHPAPVNTCPEGEPDWVLAICYDEKSSRGITALRADVSAPCCSSCACGGSSSCGCGCHPGQSSNGQNRQATQTQQSKKKPLQCEPTLTCETYKFMVYRAPKIRNPWYGDEKSRLDTEWSKGFALLAERLPDYPADNESFETLGAWITHFHRAVWELVTETDCVEQEQRKTIENYTVPRRENYRTLPAYRKVILEHAQQQILPVIVSSQLAQLCQFLKLDCQKPVDRNCVPLARLRVKSPDCQVLSICSIEAREYVFSALVEELYSFVRPLLPQVFGALCCQRSRQPIQELPISNFSSNIRANMVRAVRGETESAKYTSTILEESFGNPQREVGLEAMILSLMGATDSTGKPFVAPEELASPASLLLVNQTLRPALQAILPKSWSGILIAAGRQSAEDKARLSRVARTGSAAGEVVQMRETIGELREVIKGQDERIKNLEASIRRAGLDR